EPTPATASLDNTTKLKEEQQEQLRKINLLFDDNAKNYETIDFNGLYELLKGIAEREREITTKRELLPKARESKPIEYQIITKRLKLKKPPSSPENKEGS